MPRQLLEHVRLAINVSKEKTNDVRAGNTDASGRCLMNRKLLSICSWSDPSGAYSSGCFLGCNCTQARTYAYMHTHTHSLFLLTTHIVRQVHANSQTQTNDVKHPDGHLHTSLRTFVTYRFQWLGLHPHQWWSWSWSSVKEDADDVLSDIHVEQEKECNLSD